MKTLVITPDRCAGRPVSGRDGCPAGTAISAVLGAPVLGAAVLGAAARAPRRGIAR